MHKIKVFSDVGSSGIQKVEKQSNNFLAALHDAGDAVLSITSAMCTVSGSPEEEIYQCFAITIVYEQA